jgi:hypothetical protein
MQYPLVIELAEAVVLYIWPGTSISQSSPVDVSFSFNLHIR